MLPKVEIRKSAAGYYDYAAANLELTLILSDILLNIPDPDF